MLRHLTHGFPSDVLVCGEALPINTNWRAAALSETRRDDLSKRENDLRELVLLYGRDGELPNIVQEKPDEALLAAREWKAKAFEAMEYGNNRRKVRSSGRVFDLDADATIIECDFLRYYHIDLAADSLHWYKFVMLLLGLMRYQDSLLSQAMSARSPIPDSAKGEERKRLVALKRAWALPLTEDEAIEELKRRF